MSVRTYGVRHVTEYRYGSTMTDGFTMAHLLPRRTPSQEIITSALRVDPEPDELEHVEDVFGNQVALLAVHHGHDHLTVEATSEVRVEVDELTAGGPPWPVVVEAVTGLMGDEGVGIGPFAARSSLAPAVAELALLTDPAFTPHRTIVDAVRDLCHGIYTSFAFDPGFTDVTTPISAVLAARRGVCQDFAHVGVACLRSIGLAARYVSGYIETIPAPGQAKLIGVDASHAWCSVWIPRLGWLDFDPTNDQVPPRSHVTVAWGRDYADVAPVRGVVIGPGGGQDLRVAVDVTRLG